VASSHRVGVCLDTCHLFAAGYDIRSPKAYGETMRALATYVGVSRVKAIHLNDSRLGLGSRIDRHAHIGEGQLGLRTFALFLNDPRFRRVPMILETPKGDDPVADRCNWPAAMLLNGIGRQGTPGDRPPLRGDGAPGARPP
jgi:deoxyribonuclease-4